MKRKLQGVGGNRSRALHFAIAIAVLAVGARPAGAAERVPEIPGGGYYSVSRPDVLCPPPACPGVVVRLLNQRLTPCLDGPSGAACHLAAVDWSLLGLNPEMLTAFENALDSDRAIVRGVILPGRDNLGLFVVTEGWVSASERPKAGRFYRISGPDSRAVVLNAKKPRRLEIGARWRFGRATSRPSRQGTPADSGSEEPGSGRRS